MIKINIDRIIKNIPIVISKGKDKIYYLEKNERLLEQNIELLKEAVKGN